MTIFDWKYERDGWEFLEIVKVKQELSLQCFVCLMQAGHVLGMQKGGYSDASLVASL